MNQEKITILTLTLWLIKKWKSESENTDEDSKTSSQEKNYDDTKTSCQKNIEALEVALVNALNNNETLIEKRKLSYQ